MRSTESIAIWVTTMLMMELIYLLIVEMSDSSFIKPFYKIG